MPTVRLRRGSLIALAIAALVVIVLGLLAATGVRRSCDGPCPDAVAVSDRFWFLHRDLGPTGSLTVRLTSMTGTITYPPPDHDEIVSGLVPWAKTGIIIKDGVRPGSRYAALMMTGDHGVRFQHDYRHDVAGSSATAGWLRLTRSGDTITGAESADGKQWQTVGETRLDGLPDTVQVGMFATSPGDLTLRRVGLGGAIQEARFSQAVGTFDNVTGEGGAWRSEPIGEMNHTDWERFHHASGAVQQGGTVTVSGTGDIGPASEDRIPAVESTLAGLLVALIVVLVVGVRAPSAAAAGLGAFVTGLVAAGVVVGVYMVKLSAVQPLPLWTGLRVIVGVAAALGLSTVLAYGLGRAIRRRWVAIVAALSLVALPYAITVLPLLPDAVADWLLRLTPAAAFAVKQTLIEYPQVTAHYAPSAGYFPLPWWAGLMVLTAYTVGVFWFGRGRRPAWR
ncbi:MAG: hypothetical protein ABW046_18940 [Actinoplanes sp.]